MWGDKMMWAKRNDDCVNWGQTAFLDTLKLWRIYWRWWLWVDYGRRKWFFGGEGTVEELFIRLNLDRNSDETWNLSGKSGKMYIRAQPNELQDSADFRTNSSEQITEEFLIRRILSELLVDCNKFMDWFVQNLVEFKKRLLNFLNNKNLADLTKNNKFKCSECDLKPDEKQKTINRTLTDTSKPFQPKFWQFSAEFEFWRFFEKFFSDFYWQSQSCFPQLLCVKFSRSTKRFGILYSFLYFKLFTF